MYLNILVVRHYSLTSCHGSIPTSSAVSLKKSTFIIISRQRRNGPPGTRIQCGIQRYGKNLATVRLANECDTSGASVIRHSEVSVRKKLSDISRSDPMLRHVVLILVIPQQKVDLARLAFLHRWCNMLYDIVVHQFSCL
jgi:hypothetical protein